MDPLDHPVWFALGGPHAALAEVHGPLRSYPEDIAPFSAFLERGQALDDALTSLRRPVVLFRPEVEPGPPGWTLRHSGEVVREEHTTWPPCSARGTRAGLRLPGPAGVELRRWRGLRRGRGHSADVG